MKKKLLIPGIEINHSGNPYKQVILTSNFFFEIQILQLFNFSSINFENGLKYQNQIRPVRFMHHFVPVLTPAIFCFG